MAQDKDVREIKPVSAVIPPTSAEPSIRPVEPGDGPAIHTLLTSCLPDVLTDRDRWLARWRWQYWDNPFRDMRPAGFVVADGDRIHAHLGAVYLPLRIGDAQAMGVVGADYAVSQEAIARRGMFVALELAEKLSTVLPGAVMMATTANEKTGAIFGRFGCKSVDWTREFWRASTGLPQQIRTCCGGSSRIIRRAMNSRIGPWVSNALVAGWRLSGRLPRISIQRGCSLDTTVPQLAHEVGPLWEAIRSRKAAADKPNNATTALGDVSVDRRQAYLDWRYARHPERDRIRVLTVRDEAGQALGAVIVFRDERPDRHLAYIEELVCAPGRRDVMRTLLCAALRLAATGGAEYLVTTPGIREMRDLYWELGFEDRARNAPALLVSLPESCDTHAKDHHSHIDRIEFWHGMMF